MDAFIVLILFLLLNQETIMYFSRVFLLGNLNINSKLVMFFVSSEQIMTKKELKKFPVFLMIQSIFYCVLMHLKISFPINAGFFD